MKKIALIAILPFLIKASFAEQLPIDPNAKLRGGVNVGYGDDGYRADNSLSFFPQAFYDNNRWYLEGAEGGFYPYKDSQNHFRVGLTYDGRSFDPQDGDTEAVKTAKERKWSALAHASYMRVTPYGGFKIKVAQDLLSRHDSQTAQLSYIARFKFLDDKLVVYPSAGFAWYSQDYNQYYYGIENGESASLAPYSAKSSTSPYMSLTGEYFFNDKLSVFGNGKAEKLSSTQKNSPLVDGSVSTTMRIGVNYSF